MKRIALALAVVMIISVFAGCQDKETVTAEPDVNELLDAALAIFTEEQTFSPSVYYSDAEKGSDNYLDLGTMSYYFLGEYDVDITELALVEEYALALNTAFVAFEIDVMKAKSPAAAKEVQTLLNKRLNQKTLNRGEIVNYDSAQLPILDGAEIITNGSYVFLIATPDNSAVKAKINEYFSSASNDTTAEKTDNVSGDNITDALSHVNNSIGGGNSAVVTIPETSKEPSELPEMTVTSFSAPNRIVLGGSCSEGAKIIVRYDDKEFIYGTDYNSWLCEVEIPEEGITNLSVYQLEKGKSESEPITVTAQPNPNVNLSSHGVCQVAVGDNFQGHFFGQIADWCGTNLLSDKQIEGVTSRIKDKVDYLATQNCELVYVIVPNPMAVYPETVPERYVKSDKETSRTEQFEKCAIEAGASVVDLTEIFSKHRDDEFKIFNKMDSHWTDYGAYFGYYALMEHISKKWPDAKPLEIDGNFEFYTKEVDAGDMMTHLEIKNSLIKEVATFGKFLIPAVDKPDYYMSGRNELNFNPVKDKKTVVNSISEGNLPTAMVVRDSFSTNIYPYLNNAFSAVYYQSMWDYKFNKNYIEQTNPDYYIVLVAERNISNLLG